MLRAFALSRISLGMTQQQVEAITGFYDKMIEDSVAPVIKVNLEESNKQFDEWVESIGKEREAVEAYAGRWLVETLKLQDDELKVLEKTGLANHPVVLRLAAQAGLDTGEDISVSPTMGQTFTQDQQQAKKEADDIIGNP